MQDVVLKEIRDELLKSGKSGHTHVTKKVLGATREIVFKRYENSQGGE